MYDFIELNDLKGFDYDLSDTQDGLKCCKMGFIFLVNKDSGERSRAHGPSVLIHIAAF